jgi:hypothetical protein
LTFLRSSLKNAFACKKIGGEAIHLTISLDFDLRWLTSDVVGLARCNYGDGEFGRLAILADALMDAGCGDEEILAHCRSEGPHVSGCWVIDLLLANEGRQAEPSDRFA